MAVALASIHQRAQDVEELRLSLDFIDDDEPGRGGEREIRVSKPSDVLWKLEVEEGRGTVSGDHPGERRLSTLTRPDQSCNRRPA